MTHLKKYWIWYLVAAVVVTIAILAYFNWETVKGWFSSEEDAAGTGERTGNSSGSCVSLGGDACSYLGLYVPCAECTKRGIAIK